MTHREQQTKGKENDASVLYPSEWKWRKCFKHPEVLSTFKLSNVHE